MISVMIKDLQDRLVDKEKEINDLKLRVKSLEEKMELDALKHYNEVQKLDDYK